LSLDDVYVANILKCRPPLNRDPLPDEIAAHTPWLLKQIKDMKPKVVCSLGNYATKFFMAGGVVEDMGSQLGITSVHGQVQDCVLRLQATGDRSQEEISFKLIPLFHSAAIIYNRTKLTPLWEGDMRIVRNFISNNQVVGGRE